MDLDVAFSVEGYPLARRPRRVAIGPACARSRRRSSTRIRRSPSGSQIPFYSSRRIRDRHALRREERVAGAGRRALPAAAAADVADVDDAVRVVGRAARRATTSGGNPANFAAVIAAPGARDLGVQPYAKNRATCRSRSRSMPHDTNPRGNCRRSSSRPASRDGSRRVQRPRASWPRCRRCMRRRWITIASCSPRRWKSRRRTHAQSRVHVGQGRHRQGLATNRRSARACWRISARPGTASVPASPGSSAGTRCGPRSRRLPTAGSTRHGPALQFLASQQRADGKIPHEISQSATFVPWFTGYPLRVGERGRHAALRDRARRLLAGDRRSRFLDASWPAIVKAYTFSRATDRDGKRPHREHERRPRLGRGRCTLPGARGTVSAGPLDRSAARAGGAGSRAWRLGTRGTGRGRRRTGTDRRRIHLLAATGPALRIRTRTPTTTPGVAEPGPSERGVRQPWMRSRPRGSSRRTPCCLRCRSGGGHSIPRAHNCRSITWAAARWPPTGARGCCRTRVPCTIRCRITTARCGALHGMDLHGGVSLRTSARRLRGADAQCAPHGGRRARLDHRVDFGGPQHAVRRSSHHQVWSQAMVRRRSFAACSHRGRAWRLGPHVRPATARRLMSAHVRHVAAAGAFYDLDVERTLETLRDQRQCRWQCSCSASASATAMSAVKPRRSPRSPLSSRLPCRSTRR